MTEDLVGFLGIEEIAKKAVESKEYNLMIEKMRSAKKIYLIGNGGLHYVASHMATDLSRLVDNKMVTSFDSVGFITSNANDYGYSSLFLRWLEVTVLEEDYDNSLVIGLSCSGNSSNVINALHWARDSGIDTFMISGQKSNKLDNKIGELVFEAEYFHTVEVLCMILFYDSIHKLGSNCPDISAEKDRLVDSPLRN